MYSRRDTLFAIFLLAVYFFAYTANNNWIRIICSFVAILSLIISLIIIQKNKNLSSRQKRIYWIILLPVFSLVVNIVSLIF